MTPMRPGHPCGQVGCSAVTTSRYCPAHAPIRLRAERADLDARRGSAAARGYGPRHKQWRATLLADHPICDRCGREPATVADHIVPLRDGGTWALSNGSALCRNCHAVKTGEDVRRRNLRRTTS